MYLTFVCVGFVNFVLYFVLSYTLKIIKITELTDKKDWLFRNHFCSFTHLCKIYGGESSILYLMTL